MLQAAIKLVGEMFPWTSDQSSYKYLRESHNSLIGLRRFGRRADAKLIKAITEDDFICLFENDPKTESIQCDNHYSTNALPRVGLIDSPHGTQQEFQNTYQQETSIQNNIIYNLFAYPAQFLLDAAAYVSSSLLSLSEVDTSPDFVTISFYKMFGFPTGLGALIVKNELEPILRKRYFGGGTLDSIVYDRPWQKFRKSLHERYERWHEQGDFGNPGSSARWTKLDSEDIIDSFYNGKHVTTIQDMWNGKTSRNDSDFCWCQ
ncbi:unnamed protein product [Rhizophagus irregularis]|nr:unnamed protein product [Rhizophagus irregularis]